MAESNTSGGGPAGLARCSKCRSETVPVTVDGGAGEALPLFLLGKSIKQERLVQVVRQPLRGALCLNCGTLVAHTALSREETAAYRQRYYGRDQIDPAQSRTLVKKPDAG